MNIDLRPSRALAALLLLAHGGGIVLLALTELPWWLAATAAMALVVNGCYQAWRTALLRAPRSICAIEISNGGEPDVYVRIRAGERLACEVLPTTYVGPFLTVINLRQTATGTVRHIVIVKDGIAPEEFRKLRVWLRWHRSAGPG